jgi:hypothetical protein
MHGIFISAPIDGQIYVAERNDDVLGQHRGLDLAHQPTERERDHGLPQLRGAADIAADRRRSLWRRTVRPCP